MTTDPTGFPLTDKDGHIKAVSAPGDDALLVRLALASQENRTPLVPILPPSKTAEPSPWFPEESEEGGHDGP